MEEGVIFPAIRSSLSEESQQEMLREMQARRKQG
jgi:hemerythrin-like domain-containing protein